MDNDTFEFIEDVNYNLFLNKINVFSDTCKNDNLTTLPIVILFDSITFSKVNYKTIGLKKESITKTVFLTKNIINLDEIVIVSSKANEIILGEKNRFVKRYSNSIPKDLSFGIAFKNESDANLELDKIVFYIEKIKYRTAYKINFFDFNQIPISIGHQYAVIGKLLFSTDTLYLAPKQKGAVEIKLNEKNTILKEKSVFVSLELIANYDDNNNEINPSFTDSSKLKFQLSKKANYFAKTQNAITNVLSTNLININAWINYDFAYAFYKKPHKSIIVTPSILLLTHKL